MVVPPWGRAGGEPASARHRRVASTCPTPPSPVLEEALDQPLHEHGGQGEDEDDEGARVRGRHYTIGPFATVVGVFFPWLIGMVMLVKWLIEGLF